MKGTLSCKRDRVLFYDRTIKAYRISEDRLSEEKLILIIDIFKPCDIIVTKRYNYITLREMYEKEKV
jgi:hypothetical protein